MKLKSGAKPPAFDISVSGSTATIRFAENITETEIAEKVHTNRRGKAVEADEQTEDGETHTVYEYDGYTLTVPYREGLKESIGASLTEWLEKAKQEEQDALAAEIRAKRNELLAETDKEMTLDRLDVDTSSATKFIKSIASVFDGDMAAYRKALRDVPQQDGFPYNVTFPTKPN